MTEDRIQHVAASEPSIISDATLSVLAVLRAAMRRIGQPNMRFILEAPRPEAVRGHLPALSVYLHDVEHCRDEGPDVFRLHYLASAWASTPTEEQVLYSAALRAVLLKPTIEGAELAGASFEGQSMALPLVLSNRLDESGLSRFWQAVGQPPRPTIQCWTSISALRPEDDMTPVAPPVLEREIRFARKRSLS